MSSNPFKVSGPEVQYIIKEAQCCRRWPVVTSTLTWTEDMDGWKHESWGWRRCGYCNENPRPVEER